MSTIRHLNMRIKAAAGGGMRLTGTCVATGGFGTFSFYIGNPPAQPPVTGGSGDDPYTEPSTYDTAGSTTITNLISAGGSDILIPGDITYLISSPITIPNGKTLRAATGSQVTLKAATGYALQIIKMNAGSATLRNVTLDGHWTTRSAQEAATSAAGIEVQGGSGINIHNCRIRHMPSYGLWMYNSNDISIKSNIFDECYQPIRFDGNNLSATGVVDGNTFTNTNAFKSLQGFEAINCKSLIIRRNTMSGIGLKEPVSHPFEGAWGNSLYLWNSDACYIENNVAGHNVWSALVLGQNNTNAVVQHNTFYDGTIGDTTHTPCAIWVEQASCSAATITKNIIEGSIEIGDTGGDHSIITNNVITTRERGINVNSAAKDILIQGNQITRISGTSVTSDGLFLWEKSTATGIDCRVLNNNIFGFTQGVFINNTGSTGTVFDVTITGNHFSGNGANVVKPAGVTYDASCVITSASAALLAEPAPIGPFNTTPANGPNPNIWYIGTNFSGMEWAAPGIRYGRSTQPNFNYTVPRKADAYYMAYLGYNRVRLPIQWELLQPVLAGRTANATISAALSANNGSFRQLYQDHITYVLDACRTAGLTCILDLHNYCRYQDFSWSTDGSVVGFTYDGTADNVMAYTTDNTKVLKRIMALTAATASCLTITQFQDFWTRAAQTWGTHEGLGGYGLMNEPNLMPEAGGTNANAANQDGSIWITFAQAGVNAIRSVDACTPIYVAGNNYSSVMDLDKNNASTNPALASVSGADLVFEGHMYLDARSSGQWFDWSVEEVAGFSAGEPGASGITTATGKNRLSIGAAWATSNSFRLAVGEIGMPIDDSRWFDSFNGAVQLARNDNIEVYSWMGGNHWPIHAYAINHVPQWHQHKTMEPLVSGIMRHHANLTFASKVFDTSSNGYLSATAQTATVTLFSRGNLGSNLSIGVAVVAGAGTLSTATVVLSAGPNKSTSYTFIPTSAVPATIRYTPAQAGFTIPDRLVYCLTDPVAYEATNASAAAHAIIAKYNSCLWRASDAYTDYLASASACGQGSNVRAIADTGWGSLSGNPMEMIQWINLDLSTMGSMVLPTWETAGGLARINLTVADTWGLWCKKATVTLDNVQPNPVQQTPYHLGDNHFHIVAMGTGPTVNTGTIFMAGVVESGVRSELRLLSGAPSAVITDGITTHTRTGTTLSTNTAFVVTMLSTGSGTSETVRVNTTQVASGSSTAVTAITFNQMTLGWSYYDYFTRGSFQGYIYAAVTGTGAPTLSEVAVVERYLGTLAGLSL